MCRRRTTPARSRSRGGCPISPTTPSPGEVVMTASLKIASGQAGPGAPPRPAPDLLIEARALERAVCMAGAAASYEAAIAAADATGEHAVLSEGLRRLAIIRHHRGEAAQAREMCRRSY